MVKVTKNFSEVQEIKVTQSRLDNLAKIFLLKVSMVTPQKFLERVRPTGDCEKPNIELVLKTTLSNIKNYDIVNKIISNFR